jgi:hypothetical protein
MTFFFEMKKQVKKKPGRPAKVSGTTWGYPEPKTGVSDNF